MAINIPRVSTDINGPLPTTTPNESALKAFLTGMQQYGEGSNQKELQKLKQDADLAKLLKEDELKKNRHAENIQEAQKLFAEGQGKRGVSVTPEGVSITPHDNLAGLLRQQGLDEKKTEHFDKLTGDYTKRLGDISAFNSALGELETGTNTDGKGGILSNPNAKMVSTGKFMSSVPTPVLGTAEAVGSVLPKPAKDVLNTLGIGGAIPPEGSANERKSVERLVLAYAKLMGGARGVNPSMIKAEKEATGWINSGDPQLVSKGVRSLANMARQKIRIDQAGYPQDVLESVHQKMGGNPLDLYSSLPEDNTFAKTAPTRDLPVNPRIPAQDTSISLGSSPQSSASGGLSPEEKAELDSLRKRLGRSQSP